MSAELALGRVTVTVTSGSVEKAGAEGSLRSEVEKPGASLKPRLMGSTAWVGAPVMVLLRPGMRGASWGGGAAVTAEGLWEKDAEEEEEEEEEEEGRGEGECEVEPDLRKI